MEIHPISNLLNLSGKTAIVTGGALGIGYGISYRLAEAGANVVIANRTIEEGIKAAENLSAKGWKAKAVATDVSIEDQVKKMVDETIAAFGTVTSWNNAGIYPSIPV